MHKDENDNNKIKALQINKRKYIAIGTSMGVVAGAVIGKIFDESGLWISLCIAIGAGIGATLGKKSQLDDEV